MLLNTIISVEIKDLTIGLVIGIIIVFILIFLSALVSGSEVSFFSLSSKNLEDLSEIDEKKEDQIRSLLSNPNKLLATILITNNFINVAIIILSSYLTANIFDFSSSKTFQFIVQVIVITFVLVLLGEITPKVYAKQNAVLFSKRMSSIIKFFETIFSPFSSILIKTSSFIDKRLKQKSIDISMEEISQAIELASDGDQLEEEKKILKSIVEFGNIDVREIMKPRIDVVSLEKNVSFDQVLNLIVSSSYSRIPVYEGSFDNIHGVLYIKDLIPHISSKNVDWNSMCHEALFVPETKKINDLLKEFQEKKIHLAIVVDEYGGTSGIVTLEDVLEEIVGEINDEFDDDGNQYSKLDRDNFVFEAKISINDFLKVVEGETDYFDEIKGDADTLAGLIIERTGIIPKISDKVDFPPYTFFIESADERKINRVKVHIHR
ncbi:MAG: hemolysin [Flavobacteriales bacterium]|nr:hemolysin [Flavobacteriales bacterium]